MIKMGLKKLLFTEYDLPDFFAYTPEKRYNAVLFVFNILIAI